MRRSRSGRLFSRLPQDVGQTVFEYAAEDRIRDALSFALVSKQVKSWVEPIIYRDIEFCDRGASDSFYRWLIEAPTSSKPDDFLGLHVKSLRLHSSTQPEHIPAILRACHGAQLIACWVPDQRRSSEDLRALMISTLLAPTKLSVTGDSFSKGRRNFSHPIFQNLTHLEVIWDYSDEWVWDAMPKLKYLTHISLDIRYLEDMQTDLLKQTIIRLPPSVCVIVIFAPFLPLVSSEDSTFAYDIDAICGNDLRVVSAWVKDMPLYYERSFGPGIVTTTDDINRDWSHVHLSNDSFWTQAENIINRRRRVAEVKTT